VSAAGAAAAESAAARSRRTAALRRKYARRHVAGRIGVYVAAILAALFCAAPFLWSLITHEDVMVGFNLPSLLIAVIGAVVVIAITIFFCFAYADRVQRLLGPGGTDIAVRLSAFILFCLGIQILWSGGSELLRSVIHSGS